MTMRRVYLAALVAALILVLAATPSPSQGAAAPGQLDRVTAGWSSLSWCPCLVVPPNETGGVRAVSPLGSRWILALGSDGSLYLAGESGLGEPWPLLRVAGIKQNSWGARGSTVFVAGASSAGVAAVRGGEPLLWYSSTYARPKLGSLWFDPLTGVAWVVDEAGNLYRASLGSSWQVVAGPSAPASALSRAVAGALSSIARSYIEEEALKAYPNSTLISSGAAALESPRFLWAGAIYVVDANYSAPWASRVPVAASAEVEAWALLETPSGEVNYTETLNSQAVLLLDLSRGSPSLVAAFKEWGLGGRPLPQLLLGAWDPNASHGLLVELAPQAGGLEARIYTVSGDVYNASLRDVCPLGSTAPEGWFAPLLDAGRGEPAIALAGSGRVYYYSYTPSGPTLQWITEPFPGGGVESIAPAPYGVAVAGPQGLQLLALRDGSRLWAGRLGVPLAGRSVAPTSWGVAAAGQDGSLVVVESTGPLSGVIVEARASGHPLGPGLRVELKAAGSAYSSPTDAGGTALFVVQPGSYTAEALDPLLGPAASLVRGPPGEVVFAGLHYSVNVVHVRVYRAPDPLGLLVGGPAAGARGYIASPWGSVEAVVAGTGELEPLLPPYLSWVDGIPLRAGYEGSYTLNLSLKGYKTYDGRLEANVTLEPILAPLRIAAVDEYTESLVPFNATITLLSTGRTARISSSGALTLHVPPGPYELEVSSRGYLPSRRAFNLSNGLSMTLRLARVNSTVEVVVRDPDYGFPLNATLILEGPVGRLVVPVVEGRASASLPWGTYNVTLKAPGYNAWRGSLSLGPGEQRILVVEPDPLRYNVTLLIRDGLTGEPVNATVTAYIYTPLGRLALGSWQAVNGVARLTLRPWNASVVVEAGGYEEAEIPVPRAATLTVALERIPGVLEVIVVDSLTGLPVNASLHLSGPGGYEVDTTAAGGRALLDLPWGRYTLEVSAHGYRAARLEVPIEPSAASRVVVKLNASTAPSVVRVVDALTGEPVAFNYTLEALTEKGAYTLAQGEARGFLEVRIPLAWRCVLRIESAGYHPAEVALGPGNTTVALERLEGALRVSVVDSETGSPIAGARVVLRIANKTLTVPVGEEVEIPWGIYSITVEAPNYTAYRGALSLGPRELLNVTIRLERERVPVEIRLVDSLTKTVILEISRAEAVSIESGDRVSGSGVGNITLWLRVGEEYTVNVSAEGYRPVSLTLEAVKPRLLTLRLERVERPVLIIVRDSYTGRPVADALVSISSRWVSLNVTTSRAGIAAVELPWGSYTLRVSAPFFEELSTNMTVPIETPSPNATRELVLTLSLTRLTATLKLSVVDSETGSAIPAVIVLRGPQGILGPLNTSGGLTLLLPQGHYSVSARAPGYREASIDVYLTGDTNLTLRLQRLYTRVTIQVYDKSTGALVPSVIAVASELYGFREVHQAPGGVVTVLLLQGVPYTITVNPLKPYYYPATLDLVVPVGKGKYVEAIPLERPSYNVTVVAVNAKGKELRGATITLMSRLMRLTLASGESASIPAGAYKAVVKYKGGVYVSEVNVTGPGLVVVHTGASAVPLKALAVTAVASSAVTAAATLYLLRRGALPGRGGEEESPPPYEELVGGRG